MAARRFFTFATGVLAVLVLAFAGFATGSSASVGAAGRAAADTFGDPAGDSAGAPDVTQVAISDVGATGMIKVAVTVSGIESSATHLFVFLNTDMDASTGFADGSEYALSLIPDDQGELWWDVLHWDGTGWQQVPQSATLSYSRAGNVNTWTLSRADLGNPTAPGFTFYVSANAVDADDNVTASDYAPDSGSWAYLFSAPPTSAGATTAAPAAKPVIGVPATVPATAVAGKHFTVAFRVTRRGAVLDSGTMTCDPSVGGKAIPHADSFAGGTARLSFTVPKTAKGKLLKVRVTIAADNQSTTRIATFHVG